MANILLATEVPYWQRAKGNQLRIAALLDFLGEQHAITVLYIGYQPLPRPHDHLTLLKVAPHSGPKAWLQRGFNYLPANLRNRLVGLLNRRNYTREPSAFYSERALTRLTELTESVHYDAVIIEYVWCAFLVDAVPPDTVKILDTHDIVSLRAASYQRYGRIPDKVISPCEELKAFRRFDYLLAIQQQEYAFLQQMLPQRALLTMHPQRTNTQLYAQRLDTVGGAKSGLVIACIAAYSDANIDAVMWFVKEVWNEQLATHFHLKIYGHVCDGLTTEHPGIELVGWVDDISDAYRHADLIISPLRIGSGLKIKSVEALAYGMPLICTSTGAQGLEAAAGSAFMLADDPLVFRQHVLSLRDPALRQQLSSKALAYAQAELSPHACFAELNRMICALA